jgi:putative transposase/transposase-like zinc-binding protein
MVDPRSGPTKTRIELADVVRRFGPQYISHYGSGMMPSHRKALADIAACGTAELGGRLYRCEDCGDAFWRYHCCRNRACPKCHGTQTRQWLEKRQAELLPCDYFHAVVTVPQELHTAIYRQQKLLYGLLMQVAAEALKELCAVKRHLGALPGMLAALHTWNGQLGYHPHVHLLITGGGITPDGQHWKPAPGEFLVPVALLSRKVAALFQAALQAAAPEVLADLPPGIWQREWVSFLKHYGHGNDAVLNYLSRYVFRTAITAARILDMDSTHVLFRWKDRRAARWRTERLPGVEFLRRFLQHVLPRGFHKVRYYGLWHPSQRKASARAWLLLILQTPTDTAEPLKLTDLVELLAQPTDSMDRSVNEAEDDESDHPRFPSCGSGRTRLIGDYRRGHVP